MTESCVTTNDSSSPRGEKRRKSSGRTSRRGGALQGCDNLFLDPSWIRPPHPCPGQADPSELLGIPSDEAASVRANRASTVSSGTLPRCWRCSKIASACQGGCSAEVETNVSRILGVWNDPLATLSSYGIQDPQHNVPLYLVSAMDPGPQSCAFSNERRNTQECQTLQLPQL